MRLLVEIGNSRIKWALADENGLLSGVDASRHDDPCWTRHLPESHIDAVWYASVAAPAVQQSLLEWADDRGLMAPHRVVSKPHMAGVINAYDESSRLGIDRLLASVAAHHAYPKESVMVVDAGTALTIDCVRADGRHQGGLICPGVATMRNAIRADTQVRADDRADSDEWLGVDTDKAVGLGTLHAALGLIERLQTALGPARLLLTGGEAPLLAQHLSVSPDMAPNLVLRGLEVVSRVTPPQSG